MLYEDWAKSNNFKSDSQFYPFNEINNISDSINEAWYKTGKPWLNSLSESVMAFFSIEDFKREVLPHLNESTDFDSIKESYAIYELSLLHTHRPDWFMDEKEIVVLPNYDEHKVILSKNESLFIISMSTWSAIQESNWLSKAYEKGKELAGDAWNLLKSGAQKVWGFISKLAVTTWEYTKKNPLEVAAITLNVLGGIMAFVPAVGQIVAPIATVLSGGIEVVAGSLKINTGVNFLKEITDPFIKSMAAAREGIPYLCAGGVTMFLGASDMITAVKDATPGMLGIKQSTKKLAETASDKLSHTFIGHLEHGLKEAVEEFGSKYLNKAVPQSIKLASTSATALMCIVLVKLGKGVLGKLFDFIIDGISSIGKGFELLMDLPERMTDVIDELGKSDSYVAKLVHGGLKKAVQPISKALSGFIDNNVRPIAEPVTSYLNLLPANYKSALETLEKHVKDMKDAPITVEHNKVEKEEITLSSEEKSTLKQLKSGSFSKSNKSVNSYEKSFKEADPNFKGIQGDSKKVNVEFEGWGKDKIDAWKKEMTLQDLEKNMKSKDWAKLRFEYDGKYPTDLHKGGRYVRLKAIKESEILKFDEWTRDI
jgi:hypothetical protein